MPAPFRGALTLCDLEIVPSSGPQPPHLQKGMMLCPTGRCVVGPGGISRAPAEGAIAAGLRVLEAWEYTIQGVSSQELMRIFQRGESRRKELVTGLCRHRSTFPVLEGGGGNRAVESAPLIFFFFFFDSFFSRWPDPASANVKLRWDWVWLL